MEDLIIPGWSIYIISGATGWLVWLHFQTWKNERDIAINTANDKALGNEMLKLTSALEKTENRLATSINNLSQKLDIYIKNENDYLKSIVRGKV